MSHFPAATLQPPELTPTGGVSRVRAAVTVLGTVLVVVTEFALLSGVYQRGAPVREQRIEVAALSGKVADADRGSSDSLAATVSNALRRAEAAGLSRHDAAPVQAAAIAAVSSGGAPQDLAVLRSSVAKVAGRLAARQRRIDHEALAIYAALLVAASFGWMVWFRRLVARHRSLQREMTEQQARAEGEQRLAALVRNASDVVLVCDLDGQVTFATPSVRTVLGLTAGDLVGTNCTAAVDPGDRDLFLRELSSVHDGEDGPLRVRMRHADGRILHMEGTVTNLMADPAVGGLVVTVRDNTARVELEAQLTHQAFHDSLTGLANRQLFADRLSHALEQRGATPRPLVVLFCDLDEFKNVNDSRGHGAGDQVLTEVGRRALSVVRSGDTVARLGGDEFAILLEDADLPLAEQIATRLLDAIGEPVIVNGETFTVRTSIGLAAATPGEISGEDVLRNADVAMYLAKDRGKGTVAVYEATLHAEALERLAMRADLQRAIRQDELVLHFQPTVDLETGLVAGFEALVRWNHPARGLVPPVEFIPIAEQSGLIHALGSWVLRDACRSAVRLLAGHAGRLSMAVNVASQQLERADFVDEVFGVLAETGLAPEHLTLEITESVLMQDVPTIVERLSTLRARGIRIAIDDFGTGYSSLAYLRTLPLDVLKVDKAFIDRVATDSGDAALTEAILSMSAGMQLATVAEGVEHEEQAGWLAAAQCSYGQGYLWSRPVPLQQAADLLSAEQGRTGATDAVPEPDRTNGQHSSGVVPAQRVQDSEVSR